MCLSLLIYTVRPFLIHTCHAMPMPCSDHAVLLNATAQHGRREKAVLCYGLEKKNGMVGAWHRHGMAIVNQIRPHCVNQMGKTHSKPLAARHGRGTAWARHGHGMGTAWARHAMCESALRKLVPFVLSSIQYLHTPLCHPYLHLPRLPYSSPLPSCLSFMLKCFVNITKWKYVEVLQ